MSGVAAKWIIGQLGDTTHWRFSSGGDLRTPGLELNDAGFQQTSDRLVPYFWGQYRDDQPGEHVLSWAVSSDVFWVQTFEPRLTDVGLECNGNIQFANYWSLSAGCIIDQWRWNTSALRGGKALRIDPGVLGYLNLQTDRASPCGSASTGTVDTSGPPASQGGCDPDHAVARTSFRCVTA